jgi:glycosyltransferase involved in cell wall biosynthesis
MGLKTSQRITLITVSLPERRALLTEMLQSVAAQTMAPAAHIIIIDEGPQVPKLARALKMVDTEYLCQVDDDDIIYPDHIETLENNLDADVVWTWCDVTGRDWSPNQGYEPWKLQYQNYIPSNYAGRVSKIRDVGGYQPHDKNDYEDWNLLRRLESGGATFENVPVITWNYRFGLCRQTTW